MLLFGMMSNTLSICLTPKEVIREGDSMKTDEIKYKGTEVTPEHLVFLDQLRESGVTNMFGAGTYLEQCLGVKRADASNILAYWMSTFSERHGDGDR